MLNCCCALFWNNLEIVWIACVLVTVCYSPDVFKFIWPFVCDIWILTQCLVYFLCTRRSCLAVEFCWLAVKIQCCSAECLAVSGFLQISAVAGVVKVKQHLQIHFWWLNAVVLQSLFTLFRNLENWSILNYTMNFVLSLYFWIFNKWNCVLTSWCHSKMCLIYCVY